MVLAPPTGANQMWAMDFMGDSLATGRTFRTLNVVDSYTRECLAIEVDTSLSGHRVVRVLDRIGASRRLPQLIVTDHGPEFTSRAFDAWAYERGVNLHFIRPGKPIENGLVVESFFDDEARSNGKFRDECLNENWFTDLADARRKNRGLAARLQPGPAAQLARKPEPGTVRKPGHRC